MIGWLCKIIIRGLGHLPLQLRRKCGYVLGWFFSFVPTKDRLIARYQMDYFLRKEGGSAHLRKMYAVLGQSVFEALNLRPILECAASCITFPNRELMESLSCRGRPVVALTAHTGNWELLAAYIARLGVPLAAVASMTRLDWLQGALMEMRCGLGIKTIWRGGMSALWEIDEELEKGGVVAALIDQDTRVSSVFTPFFGRPVKSPSALITLGKRYEALFVSAFIFRTGFGRYKIYLEELDGSLSVEGILTEYNLRLERLIRRYPYQWVWFHKRWRSLPRLGTMKSEKYILYLEEGLPEAPEYVAKFFLKE